MHLWDADGSITVVHCLPSGLFIISLVNALAITFFLYIVHPIVIGHLNFSDGKVVRLGRESIPVVMLGFFSAAIMFEDIREDLKYKIVRNLSAIIIGWINDDRVFASSSHKHHVIKTESVIRFQVKRARITSQTDFNFCIPTFHFGGTLWNFYRSLKTQSNLEKEMNEEEGMINSIEGKSPNTMHGHKSKKRTRDDR
ncbi:hypothetical protein ZIOFF_065783 [Zingiber officinale]|uniref:Uncharacterized protein n=1 Tax=Zingiber officinale TaxID=94328 RepID=A0A8J5F1P4_ZINOF|nr:hypothetical protein ZIOFF_065783 [Zingiber officinale]